MTLMQTNLKVTKMTVIMTFYTFGTPARVLPVLFKKSQLTIKMGKTTTKMKDSRTC